MAAHCHNMKRNREKKSLVGGLFLIPVGIVEHHCINLLLNQNLKYWVGDAVVSVVWPQVILLM